MIKEFFEDALIGLGLKKDVDNRMGHSTGFAAGILLGAIVVAVIIVGNLIG